MDFFLLNYWQNESRVSIVASRILDYKFNYDSVELICGANQVSNLTYKALGERWRELFSQFYTQNLKPIEVITFPEIMEFNKTNTIWEKAMCILKKWCKSYGLIIRNYDVISHLKFSKIKIDMDENFDQRNERLLLFNPAENIILTIYFNRDAETLEEEVYDCRDEVNILSLLLRDELIGSGVTVAGIVVCSTANVHICCNCQNFIVSHNIFNSVEHFDNFWNSYIATDQDRSVTKDQGDTVKRNVFRKASSKMLGFLAHLQFKILDRAVLPTPTRCPRQAIIQTELLLNRYQIEIVYSNKNRILLTGSYGVGKTIVIYKKIQLLQKSLQEKEVIYYVNFEEKSNLDSDFRKKLKLCEEVRVIKGGFHLSDIIKQRILPKEEENGTKSIHLMVDEYDTESLRGSEASQLTEMFTNQPQFKNSTIFIAVQAMEKSYFDHETGSEIKPMLSELKKIMHVYNLKYVMRSTVEIYTLAAITQNCLTCKSGGAFLWGNDNTFDNRFRSRVYKNVYCYNLDSKIGHNIHGPLPQLIKVPTSATYFEQIALIAFFLSTVEEVHKKNMAVVHFQSEMYLEQLFHLTIFKGLKFTTDPGKFINLGLGQDNSQRNLVLVTNYRRIRGLEFPNVLLLLNEPFDNEPFIPEAMTRCMCNLSVLILPSDIGIHRDLLFLNEWEKINSKYPESPILKTVDLKFCSNPICKTQGYSYCEDGSSKYLRKFTKFYNDLFGEILAGSMPNFAGDESSRVEKTNYM